MPYLGTATTNEASLSRRGNEAGRAARLVEGSGRDYGEERANAWAALTKGEAFKLPRLLCVVVRLDAQAAKLFHETTFEPRTMTTPSAQRVRKHRLALRAAGLRPAQIWVPDTRRADFAAECRRQSRSLADSPDEQALQDWLEQEADTDSWR